MKHSKDKPDAKSSKIDAKITKEKDDVRSSRKKNGVKLSKKKNIAKSLKKKLDKKTLKKTTGVRIRVLFWTSVSLIVLACGALLLVPQAGREILDGDQSTAIAIATAFWGFEIAAYVMQAFIARTRKKLTESKIAETE